MNQFRASLRTPPANMAAHPTPVAPGARRPVAAATIRSRTVPPSQDTTRAPTPATTLAVPPTPPTSQGTIARKRPNAPTRPEDVSAPRKEEATSVRTISSVSSTKSNAPTLGRKTTPVRPESAGSMKAIRLTTPSPVTATRIAETRIAETKTPTASTPPAVSTPRASRLPLRATPSKTSTGSRTSTGTIDSPTRTVRVVTMKPMKAKMIKTPPASPTPLSSSTITTTTTTTTPPLTPRPQAVIMRPKARITPTSSTSTQSARSALKDSSNVSIPMSIISGTLVPPGTILKKRSSNLREPISKAGKVFECEEQDGPCSRESCAAIPTKAKYNEIKFAKSPTPESRESIMSAPPASNRTNLGKTSSKTIILELELPNKATSIATVGTKKGSNQTAKVVSTVSSPIASPLASPTSLKDPANSMISNSTLLTKKRLSTATSESGADQKKSTSNDHDSSLVISKKDSQSEEYMAKAKNQAQAIHSLAEKLKIHPPKSAPTSKEKTLVEKQLLSEKLTDQGLKTQRVSVSQDHLMLKQQQQQQMKSQQQQQQQQQRHETQSLAKSTKPQPILEKRPSKRSSSKISIDQKIKVYPSTSKDDNGSKQHSRRSSLSLVDEPVLKIQPKQSSLTINDESKQKIVGKKLTPNSSPTKISQTKVLKNSTLVKKTVLKDKTKDHVNDLKSKTQVGSELDDKQEKENVRSFVLVVDEPILKEKLINLVKEEEMEDQKLMYEQKKLEIEKREEALQQKLNFILKEQKRAIEDESIVDEETLSEVDQAIIASLETFGDDKERSIDTQTLSSFNISSASSTSQSGVPFEKLLALSSGSHFNEKCELDVTAVPSIPVSVATQVYGGKESKIYNVESFEPKKPSEMSFGSRTENVSSDKIPCQGTLHIGTSEISIGIKSLVDSIETERQSLLSDSDGHDELSSFGKFSTIYGEYHKGMSELSLADKTLFESPENDQDSSLSLDSDIQNEFSMFSDLHKEPGYKRNLESSCENDVNVMIQLECVKNRLYEQQTQGQLSIFEDLTSDDLSIAERGSGPRVNKDEAQFLKGNIGYNETFLTSDKTDDQSLSANKLPETKLLTKSLQFTKDDGNAYKLSENSLKSPESVPITTTKEGSIKGSVKSLNTKKSILSTRVGSPTSHGKPSLSTMKYANPVLGGSPQRTSPVGSVELKTSTSSTATTISGSNMQGKTSLPPQTEEKLSRMSPTFNKTVSLSPTSQSKMSRTSIRSLSPIGSKVSPTRARSGSPSSSRPLSPTVEGKLLPLKALSPSALTHGDKRLAETSTAYSDTLNPRTVSPSFGVKYKTLKAESSTSVSESMKEMSAPTITELSESKQTPTIRSQTLIADHLSKALEAVKETSKSIPIAKNVGLTSELTKQIPEAIAMMRKQSSTPETIIESSSTAVDSLNEMSSTLMTKLSNTMSTKEMGTSPSPTMIRDYYSTKKQDLIINPSKLSRPIILEDEKLLSESVITISTAGVEMASMSHSCQTSASPANQPKLSQSSVESESISSFQFQEEISSSIGVNSSDTSFGDNQVSPLLLSAIVKDTISSPLIRKGRNDLPREAKDLSDTSSVSTTERSPFQSSETTVISFLKPTHESDAHTKKETDIFYLANSFATRKSIADSIKKTILQIPSAAEMEEEILNIQNESIHNNSLNDEQESLSSGSQKYTPVPSIESFRTEKPSAKKSKIAVAQTLSAIASKKLSSFMKGCDILSSVQDNKEMKSADQKTSPINLERNVSPVMFSPSKERLLAQANKIPFSIQDPQVLCMGTAGTWFPPGVFDDKIAAAYFKMSQYSKYVKEKSLLENQDTTSVSFESQDETSSFTTETDESLLNKNTFPSRPMEKDSINFFGKEKMAETDDAYSESSVETQSLHSDTDVVTEDSTGLIRKEKKLLAKKHKHDGKASSGVSNASSGSRTLSRKTSIASSHLSKPTDSSSGKGFKEIIGVSSPETVLDEELLDLPPPHPLSPDSEVVMSILMPSTSYIQHKENLQPQPTTCKTYQDYQKEALIDLPIDSKQRKNKKVAGMEAASESMSVLGNIMPTYWQRNFSGVSVESKGVFQRENVPCEEPSVRPKVPQSRSPADSMGNVQLSEKPSLSSLSPPFAPRNTVQQGDAIVIEPFQKSASPVGFRDVVQPSTKLSLSTLALNVVSKHTGQESEEVSTSNLSATGSSKTTFKQASSGQTSEIPTDTSSLSATSQQVDELSTSEHTFIHPSEMAIALKSIIASLPVSTGSKEIPQKEDPLSNFSIFQSFQGSETTVSQVSEENTIESSLSEVSEEKATRHSSKGSETVNSLKDTLDSTTTILSQYKEKVQHLPTEIGFKDQSSISSSAITLKSVSEDVTLPSSICSLSNLGVVKDAFSSTPIDFEVNVVNTFIEIPKVVSEKMDKIFHTDSALRSKATTDESSASGTLENLSSGTSTSITDSSAQETSTQVKKLSVNEASKAFEEFGKESSSIAKMSDTTITSLSIGSIPFLNKLSDESTISKVNREPSSICSLSDSLRSDVSTVSTEKSFRDRSPRRTSPRSSYKHKTETSTDSSDDTITTRLTLGSYLKIDEEIKADSNESENVDDDTQHGSNSKISHESYGLSTSLGGKTVSEQTIDSKKILEKHLGEKVDIIPFFANQQDDQSLKAASTLLPPEKLLDSSYFEKVPVFPPPVAKSLEETYFMKEKYYAKVHKRHSPPSVSPSEESHFITASRAPSPITPNTSNISPPITEKLSEESEFEKPSRLPSLATPKPSEHKKMLEGTSFIRLARVPSPLTPKESEVKHCVTPNNSEDNVYSSVSPPTPRQSDVKSEGFSLPVVKLSEDSVRLSKMSSFTEPEKAAVGNDFMPAMKKTLPDTVASRLPSQPLKLGDANSRKISKLTSSTYEGNDFIPISRVHSPPTKGPSEDARFVPAAKVSSPTTPKLSEEEAIKLNLKMSSEIKQDWSSVKDAKTFSKETSSLLQTIFKSPENTSTGINSRMPSQPTDLDLPVTEPVHDTASNVSSVKTLWSDDIDKDLIQLGSVATLANTNSQLLSVETAFHKINKSIPTTEDLGLSSTSTIKKLPSSESTLTKLSRIQSLPTARPSEDGATRKVSRGPSPLLTKLPENSTNVNDQVDFVSRKLEPGHSLSSQLTMNQNSIGQRSYDVCGDLNKNQPTISFPALRLADDTTGSLLQPSTKPSDGVSNKLSRESPVVIKYSEHESSSRSPPFSEQPSFRLIPGINLENQPSIFVNSSQKDSGSSANLSEWLVGMDIVNSLDSTPQQQFSSKAITSIVPELLPNKLGLGSFGSRSQILDAKQSSFSELEQDSAVLPSRDEILKIFSVALSLGKLTPELRNVLFAISKRAASEKESTTTYDLIEVVGMSPCCSHDMLPPRKQKPLQQQQKEVLSKLSKALISGKVSQELHNSLSELCIGEKTKVEQEALYTLSGLLSPSTLSSSTSSLLTATELTAMTSLSPSTDSVEFDTNGTKLNDDSIRPKFETSLTVGSYPKKNSPNHLIGSSAIQHSAKIPSIGLQPISPQMSDFSSDVSFLNQFITTTTESDMTEEKISEVDLSGKHSKQSTLSVRDDSSKRKQKVKQSSLSLGEEPLPSSTKPSSWSVGEIMNRHLSRDKEVELKTAKFIKDVPDLVGSKMFFQEDSSSEDILAVYEGLSPRNAVLERKSSSADERPVSMVTLGKVGGESIMADDLTGSNSIKINSTNNKAPHFGEILNDAAFLSQLVTSLEKQQRLENMSVNVISEDSENSGLRSSDSCFDKTSNLMAAIDSVTLKPFQKWRSVGKQLRSDDDSSSLETDLLSPKDEKNNSTLIKSSTTNDATDSEINEDVTSWSRIAAEAVDSLSVSNNAWCSRFQKQSDMLRHDESAFHDTSVIYPEETGQDEAMPINERSTFMLDANEWKGGNLNDAANTFAPFYLNLNEQTPSQFSTSFVQQQYVNESITIVPSNQTEMIISGQQFSSEQYSASTNEQPQFVIGIPYTHSYANERAHAHHNEGPNQMLGPTGQHFLSESKIVYSPHIGCNVSYQRPNLPGTASTLPVHNSPQSSPAVRPLDRKIPQSTPAVTKLRADATPFVQGNKTNSTLTTPVFTSPYQQDQAQFANASSATYLHQNSGPKIASLPGSVQYQQGFDNAMFLSGRLDQLSYPYDRNYISDQIAYDDSINNMNWQFQVNGNRKLNLNDSSEMIPEPVADVPKPDPCSHWSSGESRTQSYDMGKSMDHRNLMSNVPQVNSNVEGVLSESREDSEDSSLPVEHFFSIVDVTLSPSFIPNRVSSRLINVENNNVDVSNRPLTPGPYVSQNESLDSQLDATEIPPPRNEHLFPTLKEAGGIAVSSALTLGKEFNGVGVGNLLKDQRMMQQQEKEMHFSNSKLSIVVSGAAEPEGNKLMSPFNIDVVSLPAEQPWSSVVSPDDYSRGSKMSSSEQQFMQNIKDWSELDEIERISAEEFYPRQDMMTHDGLRSISNWNDKLTRMSAEDFFQHRMIRHKIDDIQMDNDNVDLIREDLIINSRMSAEDFFQMCNGKHGGQWQRPESDRRFSQMSDQWPPSAQFVQNMGSSYVPNQFSQHFYQKNIPSGRPQFFSKDQNLHLHRYPDGEHFYPKNETTTMDEANSYMNSVSLSNLNAGHMNQFCAEYYIQQENGQYYNLHGQNFIHNKPEQYSVSSPQMTMSHNEGTGLPSNLISDKQGKMFHNSGITIEPDTDKYQNTNSTSGQANSEAGMRGFSSNLNNSKFKKTGLDHQIFANMNMSNFGSTADHLTKSSQGMVNPLTGECYTTDFPNLGPDDGTMPGSDLLVKVNNLLLDNDLSKIKTISLESRLSREPLSVIPEETNRLSAEDFYKTKEKWKTEQAHKYDLDAAAVFVSPQQSELFVPITKTMEDDFAIEIPSMLDSVGEISSVEVEETETQTQCVLIISVPEELVPETDFEINKRLIEERLARLMEVELATLMAPPKPDSLMVVAESSVVELLNRYRELNSQQSLLEISKSAVPSPNLSLTGMNEAGCADEEAMITVVAAANLQHSAAYRLEKFLESLSQPPVDDYSMQNTLEGTPSAGDLLDFELVDSTVEGSYASSLPADMLMYRRQDEWSQTGDMSDSAAVEIADEFSSQEYLEDIMEESGEYSSLEASMQETLNEDLLRSDETEFDVRMDSINRNENGHGDMSSYVEEEDDDEDTSFTALTVYKGHVSTSLMESSGNLSDSESKTEKLTTNSTLDGMTPSENELIPSEKPVVEVDDIGRPSEQQLVIHQTDQNPFDKWKNNQGSHVTGFCLIEQPALLSRERISTTIRKRLSEHDMKSVDPKNLMHLLVSTMDWPEESPIPKPRRNPKESGGDNNRHTPVPSPRKFKMEESIKNDIGRFGQIGITGNLEQNNFKKDILRYNYVGKDRQHVNKKKDQEKRKSPVLYLRLPKSIVSDLPPLPPSPPTTSPTTVSPRSPHTSPRSQNTSSRSQTTSPRTPNISPRTPNTSPRTPNASFRSPNTSPRSQNSTLRSQTSTPRSQNSTPRSSNTIPRSVNTTPRTPKTPNTSPRLPIVSPSTTTDLQPIASPRNTVIKQLNVVVDEDVDKENSDVDQETSDVDDKETSDFVEQKNSVFVAYTTFIDKPCNVNTAVVDKQCNVNTTVVDKQCNLNSAVVDKQCNVNTAVVDKQCNVNTAVVDKQCNVNTADKQHNVSRKDDKKKCRRSPSPLPRRRHTSPLLRSSRSPSPIPRQKLQTNEFEKEVPLHSAIRSRSTTPELDKCKENWSPIPLPRHSPKQNDIKVSPKSSKTDVLHNEMCKSDEDFKVDKSLLPEPVVTDLTRKPSLTSVETDKSDKKKKKEKENEDENEIDNEIDNDVNIDISIPEPQESSPFLVEAAASPPSSPSPPSTLPLVKTLETIPEVNSQTELPVNRAPVKKLAPLKLTKEHLLSPKFLLELLTPPSMLHAKPPPITPTAKTKQWRVPSPLPLSWLLPQSLPYRQLGIPQLNHLSSLPLSQMEPTLIKATVTPIQDPPEEWLPPRLTLPSLQKPVQKSLPNACEKTSSDESISSWHLPSPTPLPEGAVTPAPLAMEGRIEKVVEESGPSMIELAAPSSPPFPAQTQSPLFSLPFTPSPPVTSSSPTTTTNKFDSSARRSNSFHRSAYSRPLSPRSPDMQKSSQQPSQMYNGRQTISQTKCCDQRRMKQSANSEMEKVSFDNMPVDCCDSTSRSRWSPRHYTHSRSSKNSAQRSASPRAHYQKAPTPPRAEYCAMPQTQPYQQLLHSHSPPQYHQSRYQQSPNRIIDQWFPSQQEQEQFSQYSLSPYPYAVHQEQYSQGSPSYAVDDLPPIPPVAVAKRVQSPYLLRSPSPRPVSPRMPSSRYYSPPRHLPRPASPTRAVNRSPTRSMGHWAMSREMISSSARDITSSPLQTPLELHGVNKLYALVIEDESGAESDESDEAVHDAINHHIMDHQVIISEPGLSEEEDADAIANALHPEDGYPTYSMYRQYERVKNAAPAYHQSMSPFHLQSAIAMSDRVMYPPRNSYDMNWIPDNMAVADPYQDGGVETVNSDSDDELMEDQEDEAMEDMQQEILNECKLQSDLSSWPYNTATSSSPQSLQTASERWHPRDYHSTPEAYGADSTSYPFHDARGECTTSTERDEEELMRCIGHHPDATSHAYQRSFFDSSLIRKSPHQFYDLVRPEAGTDSRDIPIFCSNKVDVCKDTINVPRCLDDFMSSCEVSRKIARDDQSNKIDPMLQQLAAPHFRDVTADLIIKIGTSVFKAHRFLLAHHSGYFYNLLKERQGKLFVEVVLQDITAEAFGSLYEWMYTKQLYICFQNLLDVWHAAHVLEVTDVIQLCFDFLNEIKNKPEDLLNLYFQSRETGQKLVTDHILHVISMIYSRLCATSLFLNLDFEGLQFLLTCDNLNIKSEKDVFDSAIFWLKCNAETRTEFILELMKCIRFGYMTEAELFDTIFNENSSDIMSCLECRLMVLDGFLSNTSQHMGNKARFPHLFAVPKRVDQTETGCSSQCFGFTKDNVQKHLTSLNNTTSRFLNSPPTYHTGECVNLSQQTWSKLTPLMPFSTIVPIQNAEVNKPDKKFICAKWWAKIRESSKLEQNSAHVCPCMTKKTDGPPCTRSPSPYPEMSLSFPYAKSFSLSPSLRSSSCSPNPNSIQCRCTSPCQTKLIICKKASSLKSPTPAQNNTKNDEKIVRKSDINDKRCECNMKKCECNVRKSESNVRKSESNVRKSESNMRKYESDARNSESILIFGGLNPLESWSNSSAGKHMYQFTSKLVSGKQEGKWKKFPSELPSPRHHAVAAVSNGFIFLSGGCCPTKSRDGRHIEALNSLWRFNIKSNKWEKMADMLQSRIHHGFVALEKILVALGGQDETGRLISSVEIYNIKEDKWKNGTPMCTPRMGMGTATFHKFVWVCGGMSLKGKEKSPAITKVVECYDAMTDRWCSMNPLRFPRCFCTLVECGGFLHLVGGVTRVSARKDGVISSVASIDIHDYVTDEWSFKAALQVPRHSAAAAVLDYHLYVIGGITSLEACALDCVECYNDIKGCWDKPSVHLPMRLSGVGCVVVNIELEDE